MAGEGCPGRPGAGGLKGVEFLQWALPRLKMRWRGFRKVRGQVLKRISRRVEELGLRGLEEYRERLLADPAEWEVLARLCRVTISRFYRDRGVFDRLVREVLPDLFSRFGPLRCWSAGCASGEEAWTVVLAGRYTGIPLEVLGTDIDPVVLSRARRACYSEGSMRELPSQWLEAFSEGCLSARDGARFQQMDIREQMPDGPFHLVLCRNLVFTYFSEELQRSVLARIARRMPVGAALVVGCHERLPDLEGFTGSGSIVRRVDPPG